MSQIEPKRREKGVPGGRPKSRGPAFGTGIRSWWPIFIPVFAAFWAYHGALDGAFVFDDVPTVVGNPSLETIGGFWEAAFGSLHSPISNRPVVCLTFALNYAWGGLDPYGYHLVNLLFHAANSALLLLVIRRTLAAPNLGNTFTPEQATWTATSIATMWAVHPLTVDAVTYVTQRTTLVMAFFVLLTLYGTLRSGTEVVRTRWWTWVAVGSCALALMSKEEAAALPILVMLFDRAYLYDSFAAARAKRNGFYFALAATWLLLIACVVAGPRNPTVGFKTIPQLGPFEWLMTQAPVLVHYLRLTFWPRPLIAAYDWQFVRNLGDVWRQGLLILGLLAITMVAWQRRPQWGWLGLLFFLLLAPTSSVMPIVSESVAERRMYLPMLATLIPALLGVLWLGNRLTRVFWGPAVRGSAWMAAPLTVLVFVEAAETARYAAVFNSPMSLWTDIATKNELQNRSFLAGGILVGQSKPWLDQGRYDIAIPILERAVDCEAPKTDAIVNLAAAYSDVGKYDLAAKYYDIALKSDPNSDTALGNYSNYLSTQYQLSPPDKQLGANDPRLLTAYDCLQRAIKINPRSSNYYTTLGSICFFLNRKDEADRAVLTAIQLDPNNIHAKTNRATMLAQNGRANEALAILEPLFRQQPKNPTALQSLVQLYLRMGNKPAAMQRVQEALQIDKTNTTAQALYKELLQAGN